MNKSPDAFRTIGEVAHWLETPAHVLRFWESRFPQIAPVKRAGGRRYYRPEDMRLLGGIKHLLHEDGKTIKAVLEKLEADGVEAISGLSADLPADKASEEKPAAPDAPAVTPQEPTAPRADDTPSAPTQAREAIPDPTPALEDIDPAAVAFDAEDDVQPVADATDSPPSDIPVQEDASQIDEASQPEAETEISPTADVPIKPEISDAPKTPMEADAPDVAPDVTPTITPAAPPKEPAEHAAPRPEPVPTPTTTIDAKEATEQHPTAPPSAPSRFFFDDSDLAEADEEPDHDHSGQSLFLDTEEPLDSALPADGGAAAAPDIATDVPDDLDDSAPTGAAAISLAAELRGLDPADFTAEPKKSVLQDAVRRLSAALGEEI